VIGQCNNIHCLLDQGIFFAWKRRWHAITSHLSVFKRTFKWTPDPGIYPNNSSNVLKKCNFMSTRYKKQQCYNLCIFYAFINFWVHYSLWWSTHFIFQIELSKYVAVNTATAHAHYEGEATYNIGSSYKGRPHYNIIKIHPQIGSGGESVVWCRRESE